MDVKRLRQLEHENSRLKKLVAERDLDIEILKEAAAKMVSAQVRRQQIAYVCQRGRSQRRACALLSVARSSVGSVGLDEYKQVAELEAWVDESETEALQAYFATRHVDGMRTG